VKWLNVSSVFDKPSYVVFIKRELRCR